MSVTLNTNNVDKKKINESLMIFDVRDKSIIGQCDAYGSRITLAALAHEIIQ